MKFFDPHREIHFTKNKLPHWDQSGACYFLTFRLADSIPHRVLQEWRHEQTTWLDLHPKPHTPDLEAEYHKRFSVTIEDHLDAGHGECLLRDPEIRKLVLDALLYFDGQRYSLHSCAVMPNHVHCAISLHPDWPLEKILHSWKSYAAQAINCHLGRNRRVWQRDYFDRLIRDRFHFANCVRYIRKNPEKANLEATEYSLHQDDIARQIPDSPIG